MEMPRNVAVTQSEMHLHCTLVLAARFKFMENTGEYLQLSMALPPAHKS